MAAPRKVIRYVLIAVVAVAAGVVGFPFYTYKDHKVDSGSAYGFVIGESKLATYERAIAHFAKGRYDVFEIGRGSSAVPYNKEDPETALLEDHWQLVVDSDWWNNVIYLEFSNEELTQIWRFRTCSESP